MRELLTSQPIFIGFKVDNRLKERLETLSDADRKYVSLEGSGFLQICVAGEDRYVGRLLADRLTTDRVDDIRRNILSIVRKLGHEIGLQSNMQIIACRPVGSS